MSHRPRRTAEMGEGSQPRRTSRIAQLVRRQTMRERSLERAPSMDRLTVGFQTSSAMKAKKSSTYATPLRTPNRGHSIPRAELVLTTEKEKLPSDKKWIQAQATKVTEYLHCIESSLGADFFSRGGLKAMTIKQFVVILTHFLKKIVGNRVSIGANYVDDVAKILGQIGYPYPVNKSWLKTPSAPHAFNNVVVLLQWLLPFAINSEILADCDEYLAPSDELPDKGFAKLFMRRAEEGFILWNNSKDEELQELRESLIDEIIERKTSIKGMKAIEEEIAHLNEDLDKLCQNKVVIKGEKEFNQLDQEVKTKEKLVNKLEEECRTNQKQLNQLKDGITSKNDAIAEVKKRISDLQATISSQEMSVEERDQLIARISYLRQCLEAKKKSIGQLHDMGATNQVLLSRLIKQRIELIAKFNNYLYQIFSEPEMDVSLDVTEICLDQNSEQDLEKQLERVRTTLEQLSKRKSEEARRCNTQISELESQLSMAAYTYDKVLKQSLADVTQKCTEAEKQLDELNIELINANVEGAKQLEELTQSFKKFIEQNSKLKETVSAKSIELQKQKSQNRSMLDMLQEKVRSFIADQSAAIQRLGDAVEYFNSTMDTLNLKLNDIKGL